MILVLVWAQAKLAVFNLVAEVEPRMNRPRWQAILLPVAGFLCFVTVYVALSLHVSM